MHLTLTPQQGLPGQDTMTIHVEGDTITLDGVAYDLSAIPEGGAGHFDHETPFLGQIRRIDGKLHATVIARLGGAAPHSAPGNKIIENAAGTVDIQTVLQGTTA